MSLLLSPSPCPFSSVSSPKPEAFPNPRPIHRDKLLEVSLAFQWNVAGLGHWHLWPWPSCDSSSKSIAVFLHFTQCTGQRFTNCIYWGYATFKTLLLQCPFSSVTGGFLTFLQYLERIKLIVANRRWDLQSKYLEYCSVLMLRISILLSNIKDNWSANDVMPEKMNILSEHLISKN